jgi:hypothetical protein
VGKSVRLLEKAVVGCAGGRLDGGVWAGGRLWLKAVEGVSAGCGVEVGAAGGVGVWLELAKSMRRLLLLVSPAGWKKLVKSYPLEVSLGLEGELKSTTKLDSVLLPAAEAALLVVVVVVVVVVVGAVVAAGTLVEFETVGAGVDLAGLLAAGL